MVGNFLATLGDFLGKYRIQNILHKSTNFKIYKSERDANLFYSGRTIEARINPAH